MEIQGRKMKKEDYKKKVFEIEVCLRRMFEKAGFYIICYNKKENSVWYKDHSISINPDIRPSTKNNLKGFLYNLLKDNENKLILFISNLLKDNGLEIKKYKWDKENFIDLTINKII